jgi:hypothetical protein
MFTAQFAEHILNKLAAHKRLLQLSVSAIVVGENARSIYTVTQLAKDRFKVRYCIHSPTSESLPTLHSYSFCSLFFQNLMMQEIEEEEHAERVATTAALFKQIATRCQAKDGSDFWPTAISQAAGVLPASSSTAPATASTLPTQPKFNILEELLCNPSTTPATSEHSPTIEHHHSVEDLSENQDYSQPTLAATTAAAATAAVTTTTTSAPPPIIYVTWDYVWSHILHTMQQTVQFVASTVEERSGESPLICSAREHRQLLATAALGSVDTTREWCRGAIVWPTMEFQRVSALRYRVDWHGVTFPVFSSKFSSKNQHHLEAIDLTHAA